MKIIKNQAIIFLLVLSANIYGQSSKIDLYPEGIKCTNVLKQKIDYDESGIKREGAQDGQKEIAES